MSIACAVFVKTPGLSPLKTRLAADVGEEIALEFYQRSCAAIAEVLSHLVAQGSGLIPFWAVAEGTGLQASLWASFPRILQQGDGLGARLDSVYSTLQAQFESVILLGADCPLLSPSDLLQGVHALKSDPFVLGRACDGGFYFFGGSKSVPSSVWLETPYSEETTALELVRQLTPLGTIRELSIRGDIDTGEDWIREFSSGPEAGWLPLQRDLWEWGSSLLLKTESRI